MSDDDIAAARTALARFEHGITENDAEDNLREGLDIALHIIEDDRSDAKSKQVAQNLLNTCRKKFIHNITVELADSGLFDYEYYLHWMTLAGVFKEEGFDDDNTLSQLMDKLYIKAFNTLSKEERTSLLEILK